MKRRDFNAGLIYLKVDLAKVKDAATYDEAEKLLAEMKAEAKKLYRQLARSLHPDMNGGDKGKTDLFLLLNNTMSALDKFKLRKLGKKNASNRGRAYVRGNLGDEYRNEGTRSMWERVRGTKR